MRAATRIRTPSVCILILLATLPASAPASRAADDPPAGNRVEVGFEERLRSENWDNPNDFSDDDTDTVHQLRFRTKLWSRFTFGPRIELMAMLNNESKKIFTPDTPFKWDEVVFESLYLDVKTGGGWSTRIGRQNLMRGDGFLVFDGNPLDGSRTAYFNALDATHAFGKSKIEFIGVSDPHRDLYLPVFNDKEKPLIEWNEQALGAYYTGKEIEKTAIEAYYFYKTETGDTRQPDNPARQPDRRFHTLGGRFAREIGKSWSVGAELAVQSGTQDPDASIRAWAGTALVRRVFDVAAKPSFSLAWIGMSGDDPSTGSNEAWDPLFSRWPKWSELYIFTLAGEKGAAYWTNLGMWQAEALASPWKPLSLRATYYKMSAFHPFPGSATTFGAGKDRGDLFELRADVTAGKHWKGHILGERLAPGDFYAGTDPAWFFRVEVIYTFKHELAL
jgi:hypothetical protein